MEDKAFLGTGVRFPPQVHPATGRFVTVSGDNSIKESVYLILMTQPDLGRLFLHLTYRVKGRDAREDIVFPFYMEEQQAGAPHERDWTDRNGGIS